MDEPLKSSVYSTLETFEPQRLTFTEAELPNEPATDCQLTLADGLTLRERIVKERGGDGSYTYSITSARLTPDGSVELDEAGEVILSDRHEVCFSLTALGELGSPEALVEAMLEAREKAAANAAKAFNGLDLLANFDGRRLA